MTTDWQTATVATLELMAIVGTVLAILALRRSRDDGRALAGTIEDLSRRIDALEASFWGIPGKPAPTHGTADEGSCPGSDENLGFPGGPNSELSGSRSVGRPKAWPADLARLRRPDSESSGPPEVLVPPSYPADSMAAAPPSPEQAEARPRPAAPTLGVARRSPPEAPAVRTSRPARNPRRRVDRPASSPVPGPTLIAVPSMAGVGADSLAREANSALARRFGPIWDLADQGGTPGAIARETGQPIGQVELILGLRRPSDGQAAGEAVPHG